MYMFGKPPARSSTWLAILVLTLSIGTLQAQNRDNEVPEHRVQFRVMAMTGVIRDMAFVQKLEPIPFNVSPTHPTAWMEYRGPGPLNFYHAGDLENIEDMQNPEEVPQPVAQFNPPSSGEWLLLFVRQDTSGSSGTFRVVAIPEDNDAVTEGIRFYNLTGEPLGIDVNNENFLLQAGRRSHMNPEPGPRNAMNMKIAAQGESGWEVISSTVFGHRPNARITYYILMIDNRIRFKRFLDRVPQPEDPS